MADGSLINVPGHLRAEVDEKCGIHIHVDARPFDGRTLANLAKIIYKQEALILTAL